jgi:hypothetical protein
MMMTWPNVTDEEMTYENCEENDMKWPFSILLYSAVMMSSENVLIA